MATVFPENGRTEYTYHNGKLLTKKDKGGRVIQYEYDPSTMKLSKIHRLTQNVVSGSPTEDLSQQTRYFYNVAGRVSRIESASGTESYGYTALGQLASKVIQHAWGTLGASWTYDSEGRV